MQTMVLELVGRRPLRKAPRPIQMQTSAPSARSRGVSTRACRDQVEHYVRGMPIRAVSSLSKPSPWMMRVEKLEIPPSGEGRR